MEETEKEKRKMSRLSLIVDAWIREAEEASQWVENLEGRINNHNLEQFTTVESARSRLSELGVKLDRLESLLRNPPAKPILTEEDLNFRWKMLSDIQLRTRALARSLYALPSPNRPGNVPATDTKKCSISASCLDQALDKNATLQLSPGLPVQNSPGLKPGASVLCERVHIHGLPRFRNLRKLSHSMKVKVLPTISSVDLPNIEICFRRNASLGLGMCPQRQWEKVSKGSWARSMSPFDHKMLDIRTTGSTLENFEVSFEEEFLLYRVVFLILGILLMRLASFLSKLSVLYYCSAMAVGIIFEIWMILFQGMKLLPTGQKSSPAVFLYLCVLAIFFLAFVALAGACLGCWVVEKLVLTEDGSVDTSVSNFVAWAFRILGVILILRSSMDPLLGTLPLFSLFLLKKVLKLRCRRHVRRSLFKSPRKNKRRYQVPDSSRFDDLHDEYMYKMQNKENSKLHWPKLKNSALHPCKSSD